MPQNTMDSLWKLPDSITVAGTAYKIRTDYRVVIDLLCALSDPDMTGATQDETNLIHAMLMLQIIVPDWQRMPQEHYIEAIKAINAFIDMGEADTDKKTSVRLMDWTQDARMIIPAVNRVVGHEIRLDTYMHWWTFMGAYMEIGECAYTHILGIRHKRAKGQKLEKWEQEYIKDNRDLVILKNRLSDEEQKERAAEKQALDDLLG